MPDTSTINDLGLRNLREAVEGLGRIDYRPLAESHAQLLIRDNERRALAGLDRHDRPMVPTVRERSASLSRTLGSGPPLDPKYRQSRIVRFAEGVAYPLANGEWAATVRWPGFTDRKGRSILRHHARGRGRLPVRDVLGVSPTAMRQAQEATREFLMAEIRARLKRR